MNRNYIFLTCFIQNREMMDLCFKKLNEIVVSKRPKISYRVCFLLQNLIELRERQWKSVPERKSRLRSSKETKSIAESDDQLTFIGSSFMDTESSLSNLESAHHFGGKRYLIPLTL